MNVLTRCTVFHNLLINKPSAPSFGLFIKFGKTASFNRNYVSLKHAKLQNLMLRRNITNDSENTQVCGKMEIEFVKKLFNI